MLYNLIEWMRIEINLKINFKHKLKSVMVIYCFKLSILFVLTDLPL